MIRNLYETLPKKFQEEQVHYAREKELQLKVPFHMLIVGSTGSGKTNFLLNMIEQVNVWTRIMLFAKDLDEKLYANFIEGMREIEKKTNCSILTTSNNIETLPKLDPTWKGSQTLLIVDDMINESKNKLTVLKDYFIMGRKYGVSAVYLSQAYYPIPKILRQNSMYIVIAKIRAKDDLRRMLREYNMIQLDIDTMFKVYQEVAVFPHVLFIDTQNPNMMFRRDFTPIPALNKVEAALTEVKEKEKSSEEESEEEEEARKVKKEREKRPREVLKKHGVPKVAKKHGSQKSAKKVKADRWFNLPQF